MFKNIFNIIAKIPVKNSKKGTALKTIGE